MTWVLVQHGRAHELFEERPNFHPDLMASIVEYGGEVEVGWPYDGEAFAPPPDPEQPTRWQVQKSVVLSRLTDEQIAAIEELLWLPQNVRIRNRWYAADKPAVNSDDPDALAMLAAIEADPAVILAP